MVRSSVRAAESSERRKQHKEKQNARTQCGQKTKAGGDTIFERVAQAIATKLNSGESKTALGSAVAVGEVKVLKYILCRIEN